MGVRPARLHHTDGEENGGRGEHGHVHRHADRQQKVREDRRERAEPEGDAHYESSL